MRRIFPLKSVAAGGSSNQHGHQHGGGSSTPAPAAAKKENSRMKGTPVASRYAADLSKKCPASRSRRGDASSSDDVSLTNVRATGGGGGSSKREHWCPACPPAAENGARCDTPPSGDENNESKEVEKGVISCPGQDPPKARSRHPSADLDSISRDRGKLDIQTGFDSAVVAEVMKGHERVSSTNKYTSKRSGLGAVDNVMHERQQSSKPAVKSKATAAAATATTYAASAAPTTQEQTTRSTSAPKTRLTSSRSLAQAEPPRLHSMRILKVPDRIFETASLSSTDSTRAASDASSSTGSPTVRSPRARSREKDLLPNPPIVKTSAHSRAQSYTEGLASSRALPHSPSYARKPTDSPRVGRRELSPAIPSSPDSASSLSKGQNSKYSGARVVAERLAKAFRGSSKVKDTRAPASSDGERRTKLGQSKRMTVQAEEIADSSYDGSCSDTSSLLIGDRDRDDGVSLTNVLQLVRPGSNLVSQPQQQHSRKDSSGSTGTTGDSSLSWQEFINDGRALQGVSNDHPTPENVPDSAQIAKNSEASTGSRRWGTAAAKEGNRSPSRRLQYSPSRQERDGIPRPYSPSRQERDSIPRQYSPSRQERDNNPRQYSPSRQERDSNSRQFSPSRQERDSSSRQEKESSRQDKESSRQDKEREILKGWLEGLKRQSEGMTDDLDMKARMAEQRISALNGEQSFEAQDFLHDLRALDDDSNSHIAAGINIMQQRIKRMHEEKKRLALEVASEVKRRITERAAAKEVLVMMKREMEACVRVMEKEKLGIQSGFERELERRDNEWQKRLDDIEMEEKWLRERVRRLEEEKGGLQSELATVSVKDDGLREKVRDFELQMEGHRKRVEGTEETILDLRQSLMSSRQHARQAESELENVRKAYSEKESQCQELANQVGRLQQLCADHENSIDGLQQGLKDGVPCASELSEQNSEAVRMELIRLSTVEKTLREDLEALRGEAVSLQRVNKDLIERLGRASQTEVGAMEHNLRTELAGLQLRTAELQEENRSLVASLQETEEERDSGRGVLKTLQASLADVEDDSKSLQEEVGRERHKVQEKEREIHRLERRVDGLLKNNQMLQGILAMREKAALISDEDAKEKEKAVKEAHLLEAEMRESLQVSARQLAFMNERAELMSEKLKERDALLMVVKNECGKKDEAIRGLEQSLSDLARSMDAQNRRIMQLTNKNGELSRHLQARGKEVEDLHSKIVEDSHHRLNSTPGIDQVSVQAHDVKQELESQNLLCKLLRDKLAQSEDDLSKRSEEVAGLIRSRDWFQAELQRAQNSLGEASHRLATLERTVKQKEEIISSWKVEKQGYLQDIAKLREALPQVEREREEMRAEADEIGREALRLSAEVEVLRRKVAQLEEDVLVKEGQISILRGSCFGGSE